MLKSMGVAIVMDDFDTVIAATALMLDYAVITNNERHFRAVRRSRGQAFRLLPSALA